TVGEPDARDLPQCRVGLLRGRGVHARANPPLLGAASHRRRLALVDDLFTSLADELADRRHSGLSRGQDPLVRPSRGGQKARHDSGGPRLVKGRSYSRTRTAFGYRIRNPNRSRFFCDSEFGSVLLAATSAPISFAYRKRAAISARCTPRPRTRGRTPA